MTKYNYFKELISLQEVSDLREIDKSVKAFIQAKIPPQKVLQEKLNYIKEDRIGNALIPHKYFPSQIPTALRCLPNGDCLYNSGSILLMGDESLSRYLRACVSIELCLEEKYYTEHP